MGLEQVVTGLRVGHVDSISVSTLSEGEKRKKKKCTTRVSDSLQLQVRDLVLPCLLHLFMDGQWYANKHIIKKIRAARVNYVLRKTQRQWKRRRSRRHRFI